MSIFSDVAGIATAGLAIGGLVNSMSGGSSGSGAGNLRDYDHASKLFVANSYALVPKHTFLFHVFFDTSFGGAEEGMLVKHVNLPKISFDTKVVNVYNRPKIIQTKVHYDPVTITLHDDSSDVIRQFLFNYYKYYFADADGADFGYRGQDKPFLRAIRIYSLFNKKFSEYTLVNPVIKSMSHPEHHVGRDGDVMEHQLTVEYETVLLSGGTSSANTVNGFAELHYDASASIIPGGNSKAPTPMSMGGMNSMPLNKTQMYSSTTNTNDPGPAPSEGSNSLLSSLSAGLSAATSAMGAVGGVIGAVSAMKSGNVVGAITGAGAAIGQVERLMGGIGGTIAAAAAGPIGKNITAGSNPNSPVSIPTVGTALNAVGGAAVGVSSADVGARVTSAVGIPSSYPAGVTQLPVQNTVFSKSSGYDSSSPYAGASNISSAMPANLKLNSVEAADAAVRQAVALPSFNLSGNNSDSGWA